MSAFGRLVSFTYAVLLRYCTRLQSPSFWGGEVEILILSKMLKAPIFVFQRAEEAGRYDPVVSPCSFVKRTMPAPNVVTPKVVRQGMPSHDFE